MTDASGCLIHRTACFAQFPDFSVINQVQARYSAYSNALLAITRSSAWPSVTSNLSYVSSRTRDQDKTNTWLRAEQLDQFPYRVSPNTRIRFEHRWKQ